MKKDEKFEKQNSTICQWGVGTTPTSTMFHSSYCIDYLTFSFPFELTSCLEKTNVTDPVLQTYHEFLGVLLLKYDECVQAHPSSGFAFSYDWSIPLAYAGFKNPRTRFSYWMPRNSLNIGNFELSGACCRDFERRFINSKSSKDIDEAWHKLLDKVITKKGSFSRIDIAFDLFNIDCDHDFMWFYEKIFLERSFTSPIKTLQSNVEVNDSSNTYKEQVLTLGGDNSRIKICIYNKKLEQLSQKKIVDYKSWVRIEIRFKDTQADNFVYGLIDCWENKYEYIYGILKRYLQIKEKPKKFSQYEIVPRKLRNNWPINDFWENLLKDVPKKKIINLYEKVPLIEQKKKYTANNLDRFLSMIYLSMDQKNYNTFWNYVLSTGLTKLTASDIEKINVARNDKGFTELTSAKLLECYDNVTSDLQEALNDDTQASKILENLDSYDKSFRSLEETYEKYEKNKDLNLFIRAFKEQVGDNFNSMSSDELKQVLDSLLLFLK